MKLTDNTLKYLKEYGGLSFGERPFSHVDSLILCQLSYFKFQDLVPDLVEKMDGNDIRGVTMRSLRKHPKYNSLYVSDWYEKDNRRLYAAVARSRRYTKINRHSPYLSITLHKCYPYYLFGISTFPNLAYHSIALRKFSITIV